MQRLVFLLIAADHQFVSTGQPEMPPPLQEFHITDIQVPGTAHQLSQSDGKYRVGQKTAAGRGGISLEVKLPGRFKVSPQIAGAIKAIPGVVEVQAL